MKYDLFPLIIIFIVITLMVSVVVYVIFDMNSSDGRIGNELTITIEIMIGIFIAIIIQYNQRKNQKKIDDEKEIQRKTVFGLLYGLILFIPIPVISILKDWENIQKLDQDVRYKRITDAVLDSNKYYFELKNQLVNYTTVIDPAHLAIFNTSYSTYNICFLHIKHNPNSKEDLETLVKHYEVCLILIPDEYRDESIDQKLKEYLNEVDKTDQ